MSRSLAQSLRERGHDTLPIPARSRGSADTRSWRTPRGPRASWSRWTPIRTLVFLGRRKPPPGVVLLRLPAAELVERVDAVITAMETALTAEGLFVVIDRGGVRIRQMPRP